MFQDVLTLVGLSLGLGWVMGMMQILLLDTK